MSNKPKRSLIQVQGTSIAVLSHDRQDFICLTDIAKLKNPDHSDDVIRNWLRSRSTVEFLGVWERLNNPGFNPVEFDGIRIQTGLNSFVLTPKQWIEKTGAVGLRSSAGRYGGTYAHKDIAFEFASWVSVEFKLYLIKEFQRLKDEENDRLQLGWNLQRTLAKINYRIHTDAIKETLIPPTITKAQAGLVYATEADLLNVALFGQTAKQWRDAHSTPRETSAITLRWSSSSFSPTSKASTPCSSGKASPRRSACSSLTKSPSPRCAPSSPTPTSNA